MYTLRQMELQEQMQKEFAQKKQAAMDSIASKQKKAPSVPEEMKLEIELMLHEVQRIVDYDHAYNREVEEVSKKQAIPFARAMSRTEKYSEYKNNRDLKKLQMIKSKVKHMLKPYKEFTHKVPNAKMYGSTTVTKSFQYNKPDPFIRETEVQLENMRTYSGEYVHRLKQQGIPRENILGKEVRG